MLRASATAAKSLRLAAQTKAPVARFPLRFVTTPSSPPTVPKPTSPAASSATPAEKSGIRDPNTQFTTAPKPAAKKKRHTFRNATLLALAAGSGFVAAAAYAQKDSEFDQKFEHYVPGAKSFMNLIRYHDDSIVMALSDVGFKAYDDTVYTGRFIYTQLYSLLNMLQHNSWQGSSGSESKGPAPDKRRDVAGSAKSTSPMAIVPMSNIQVAVDIPPLYSENKAVVALSHALSTVAGSFNKRGLAPKDIQDLKDLSDALVALDESLGKLKADEAQAIKAALTEERAKFEATLAEFQDTARAALLTREAELIETANQQLVAAAAAVDERIAAELSAQRDLLERRFNRFVRARVDEERGGRLANLDRVEAQLTQLNQVAQESSNMIGQSRAVSALSVALSALRSAVLDSQTRTPFATELSAVASAATTDFPATRAAIASIPHSIAERGVFSQAELENRFDAVRKEIRSVSLVPENGNFGSQVLSATLSKVMFEKEGLVEGEDVEAVLSRASFHLRQHNLDQAARELNQLTGWPKKLAEDWITSARRRLEVEQVISVAESEELLAKLTFV